MSGRKLVGVSVAVTVLAIGSIMGVIFAMSHQRVSAPQTQVSPITVSGTLACLQLKNPQPGQSVPLVCAIGIAAHDGRHYALQDMPQGASETPFTKQITVSGDLTPPAADETYDTRGTITVKTFTAN